MARLRTRTLRFENGRVITTPEELAAAFVPEQVLQVFREGRLARWLEDTGRSELGLAVAGIAADADDVEVVRRLGVVFECEAPVKAWTAARERDATAEREANSKRWVSPRVAEQAHERDAGAEPDAAAGGVTAKIPFKRSKAGSEEFVVWHDSRQLPDWLVNSLRGASITAIHAIHANGAAYRYYLSTSGRLVGNQTRRHGPQERILSLHPQNHKVLASINDCVLRVFKEGKIARELGPIGPPWVVDAAFGPKYGWVTIVTPNEVVIVEENSGARLHRIPCEAPLAVAIDPNMWQVAVSSKSFPKVDSHLFTKYGAVTTRTSPLGSRCDFTAMAFTSQGDYIIGVDGEGNLSCWNHVLTNRLWKRAEVRVPVIALALSPTGEHGATIGADGRQILLFNQRTGGMQERYELPSDHPPASTLAFTPRGLLFTGHADGSIRIWGNVSAGRYAMLTPHGPGAGSPVTHLTIA